MPAQPALPPHPGPKPHDIQPVTTPQIPETTGQSPYPFTKVLPYGRVTVRISHGVPNEQDRAVIFEFTPQASEPCDSCFVEFRRLRCLGLDCGSARRVTASVPLTPATSSKNGQSCSIYTDLPWSICAPALGLALVPGVLDLSRNRLKPGGCLCVART